MSLLFRSEGPPYWQASQSGSSSEQAAGTGAGPPSVTSLDTAFRAPLAVPVLGLGASFALLAFGLAQQLGMLA